MGRCTKCAEGKCNGNQDDMCMDYREQDAGLGFPEEEHWEDDHERWEE